MAHLTSEQEHICNIVKVVFATISLVCSTLVIFLIVKLNKRNGYILLIASMCICQMIYDASFELSLTHSNSLCTLMYAGLFVGGLSVSIWTNIVSVVVLYMVTYLKSLNILKIYPMLFIIAFVIPLILATFNYPHEFMLHCGDSNATARGVGFFYLYGRLASTLISILTYAMTSYKVRKMKRLMHTKDSIDRLTTRMKYYVLVQILFRVFPSWSELNPGHFPLELLLAIFAPATGIAYFAVFLHMQPGAYRMFRQILNQGCFVNVIPEREERTSDMKDELDLSKETTIATTNQLNDSFRIGVGEVDRDESQALAKLLPPHFSEETQYDEHSNSDFEDEEEDYSIATSSLQNYTQLVAESIRNFTNRRDHESSNVDM